MAQQRSPLAWTGGGSQKTWKLITGSVQNRACDDLRSMVVIVMIMIRMMMAVDDGGCALGDI